MQQIKCFSVALVVMFMILLGSWTYSYATPVVGVVDPGFSSGYNLGTSLSGTANYTFTNLIGGSNAPMVKLALAFEGDVFNLGATGILSSSVASGWGMTTVGNGAYEFSLLSGAPISAGSSLRFSTNYTLLGNALSLRWDQGGPWRQVFGVVFDGAPIFGSGTTALRTPEPGSLLLLGLGLAGFLLWRRRQLARA